MPSHLNEREIPVIQFDPRLEISPFLLLKRLRQGQEILLLDVRTQPGKDTLRGAKPFPAGDWEPEADQEVVLFDENSSQAVPIGRAFQAKGFDQVRVLFGGLELYRFSLDPKVVEEDTYLISTPEDEPAPNDP